MSLMLAFAFIAKAADVTAFWDFKNDLPAGIQAATNYQGKTADIPSSVNGISMHVDATNGKLYCIGRNNAQFNQGTILQVPVQSTKDTVTVDGYPGYFHYSINGVEATEATTAHRATAAEVAKGYVEIVSTGGNCYIYSVKVVHVSMIQEKMLYSTDFTDWKDAKSNTKESKVTTDTKYSHETLTFSLLRTQISSTNGNTQKFPTWEGGYLMCDKAADPYITTSPLASITKVHFRHGATGSKRGWKLEAKGDGDDDWVTLSDAFADPASGKDVDVNVNKTNAQLRFTNLNSGQNAYLFQLDIYGNVDLGKTPTLGSFSVNGKNYAAADIFTENKDGDMVASVSISKTQTMVSESNPLTDIVTDNGDVTSITYDATGTGTDQVTVVTMTVVANGEEKAYKLTVTYKPDFTLSYYNVDGNLIGKQSVEQDAAIGQFEISDDHVTVAEGKKFRGWSVSLQSGKEKYGTDYVVTANAKLYALVTDVETANPESRYDMDLNNKFFYADDHEAFNVEGSGKFHDTQHGWVFGGSDKVRVLLGGKGYIKLSLCQYSADGDITLISPSGKVVATTNGKASKDGANGILMNESDESGEYTITFAGTTYLHNLSIVNMTTPAFTQEGNWYSVKAGDTNGLLTALEVISGNNTAADAPRSYIFLPDGTYDLGNKCLTPISGNNISLIGQSMDKTVIVNTPEAEGIGITATFFNTSNDLYMQDLTLKNAYDFNGATGRAVCLQDKGNRTIAKNVRLLSYQDTYYSNNNSAQYYWETSDIHGIVDFICGGGDAFFNQCTLTLEPGKASHITAPYTDGTDYGYVFDGCKIVGSTKKDAFDFGRAWGGTARCAFLNTVLDANAAATIRSTRWEAGGMNVIAKNFWEYNTLNESGKVISPATNNVTFKLNSQTNTYNTIMTADAASEFALDKVFATWKPAEKTVQLSVANVKVSDGVASWDATAGAAAYAVFCDGEFAGLTTTNSIAISKEAKTVAVRAANAMGGFGAATVYDISTGIQGTQAVATGAEEYYTADGIRNATLKKGINIIRKKLADGSFETVKVIK